MVRTMSFRVDHNEPISDLLTRLTEEHGEINRKLERISEISAKNDGDLKLAVSLLNAVSTEILRHAVEEEARLARVIMESDVTRESSDESVKILQEHRRIKEFFDDELPYILDENSEKQARKKIIEFTDLVIRHHKEEEKEAIPSFFESGSIKRVAWCLFGEDCFKDHSFIRRRLAQSSQKQARNSSNSRIYPSCQIGKL